MYCKPAMLVYNSYATPNLDNLSPFEVAIGRKALLVPGSNTSLESPSLVHMLKQKKSCKKDSPILEKD